MALTRARSIAGDKRILSKIDWVIGKALSRKREAKKIRADVLEMRGMIDAEKGGEGAWDLKQAPGGLVDIEFIAQYLQLVHGKTYPGILSPETETVLANAAKAGLAPAARGRVAAAGASPLPGAHPAPPALRRRAVRARGGAGAACSICWRGRANSPTSPPSTGISGIRRRRSGRASSGIIGRLPEE